MAAVTYLEDHCKSALNAAPDGTRLPYRWTINPYRGCTHGCHYCFARAYHAYLDLGVGDDFVERIVVKTNVVEVLRRELAAPKWTGEPVAMGTATDPYEPGEARYRLTQGVLGSLHAFETPVSMLTKSTLVARDLELFRRLDDTVGASVAMSISTLDDELRRLVEPGTPPARSRLEVLRRFADASVPTSVLVAPILPFLTDDEDQLESLLRACSDAGVRSVAGIVLHIRPGIREHFWPWLREALPDLYPPYQRLYGARSHAQREFRLQIAERFTRVRDRVGLDGAPRRLEARRKVEPSQLTLSL